MHGLINHAISLLIRRQFGDEIWQTIRQKMGMDTNGYYIKRKVYDDEETYKLVKTASEVLGMTANDILEAFGYFFVDYCQELGYGRMLEVMGENLYEFINNLDSLHDHMATIYAGMKAPSFRCHYDHNSDTIMLHYYSTRPNLESIVVGIIKAVAKKIHSIEIDIEVLKNRQDPQNDVQLIIYNKSPLKKKLLHNYRRQSIVSSNICIPIPNGNRNGVKEEINYIAPSTFCHGFPFHVMFDENLIVHQLGHVMDRLIPESFAVSLTMDRVFKIVRPVIDFDFQSILSHINTIFVLTLKSPYPTFLQDYIQTTESRFKGQMIHLEENNMMLFHCSISISSLDDLQQHGLYLCDIPRYDAGRDLILRSDQFRHDYEMMLELEILNDRLAETYTQLQEEKKLTEQLLYSVMPLSVAQQLRLGQKAKPCKYHMVSVLFCKISTFHQLLTDMEPTDLISLLNNIYITFDSIIDSKGEKFYKVETLGDKYMVASGIPQYRITHAKDIVNVAIKMMHSIQNEAYNGHTIMLSIGIHSGEIVAGVIGEKLPRFSIFGNTVNIASRTLTTGIPGAINITNSTYSCLDQQEYFEDKHLITPYGPVKMKGCSKPIQCYTVCYNDADRLIESCYGFINYALELLVVRKFGQETWNEIKRKAEVDIENQFLLRMIYDDQVTFDLVNVASEVLGLSQNEILEQFGAMFFKFCQESNYDKILHVLGGNLKDFLCNLDALHDHLGTIYPGMRAPSFRCVERANGTLVLHYYSGRVGLEHIVIGIVKSVAKKLHNCQVDVIIEKTRKETGDHVQFAIHMHAAESMTPLAKRRSILSLVGSPTDIDPATMNEDMLIGPSTFCKAFPFHLMIDRELTIQQSGTSVSRVVPHIGNDRYKLTHLFELVRPQMLFNFESILSHINTVFVLKSREGYLDVSQLKSSSEIFKSSNQQVLRLKGQMLYVKESDVVLFLCSPSVGNLNDLQGRGLYLSDIPIHDATRDLILLSEQFKAEYELTQKLEVLTDELQQTYRKLEEEKRRTDQLLYSILPPTVAKELRQGGTVEAKKFEAVTILFSGIVGFQKICNDSEPMVIVKLLNDIYTAFDDNIRPDVYKVETVGDMYMIVGGLPKRNNTHAKCVALMALDMIDLTQRIKLSDRNVKITIGIHSGEVVAGVVGKKLPRYCLFGNTVNIASRTQTTGIEGKVNLSEVTYGLLLEPQCEDKNFAFKERSDLVQMKGRQQPMKCYILERRNKSKTAHLIMRTNSASRSFLFKPNDPESSPQFTPPSIDSPITFRECPIKTEKLLQSVVNKLI